MLEHMTDFYRDEEGATAIEYGFIAALVAVACVGAFATLGNSVNNMYSNVVGSVSDASSP